RIYRLYCAACHGPDRQGIGDTPPLPRLAPGNLTAIHSSLSVITHGRPGTAMPGWRHVLDDDQLYVLLAYLYGTPDS
ncbi:MAG: cytochrome c, partial [Puniceicoccaceae bacterium]